MWGEMDQVCKLSSVFNCLSMLYEGRGDVFYLQVSRYCILKMLKCRVLRLHFSIHYVQVVKYHYYNYGIFINSD